MSARRRVDWPLILHDDQPPPAVRGGGTRSGIGKLAAAFQELASYVDPDDVLRRVVELAREAIGVERAAVFLLDPAGGLMLGTWGTDLKRRTVDEHHVMCDWSDVSKDVLRRATEEGAPWTLIENSPLVEQLERETRVAGRSWLVCTPVLSARRPIAMMFNDAGETGAPVDEEQQRLLAILCAFVGVLLDLPHPATGPAAHFRRTSELVTAVLRELERAPSLSGAKLARKHGISVSRLARAFKHEMGMSIVEHRNRLRIQRFFRLVDSGQRLLPAALEAGFGSYAQFHRVFKSQHRSSPVEYLGLRERKRAQAATR
jgi:AraC-like DNA-binding protein